VEWTFDPLELKNAHFQFEPAGGHLPAIYSNLYGVTTSPLHRGIKTDRLVAEWWLDSPRVIAAIQDLAPRRDGCPAAIELPAELEQWQQNDAQRVQAVQTRCARSSQNGSRAKYAAIGVRAGQKGPAYLLAPLERFLRALGRTSSRMRIREVHAARVKDEAGRAVRDQHDAHRRAAHRVGGGGC